MSQEQPTAPQGPVRFAWFGGIMEGAVGDAAALGAAVERINALGMVQADVEVERGRFSLLFDQSTVPGERLDMRKSQELIDHLETVVGLCPEPHGLESTLHGSEVYSDQVVETLFAVHAGELECVSRTRAVHPGDLKRVSNLPSGDSEFPLPRMSRATLVVLLALFLIGGGLMAYQSGLVGQLLAADSDQLELDTGRFGEMLALQTSSHWGKYHILIQRGPSYPLAPDQVEALKSEATSTAQTAAIDAVTGGRQVYVQLLNAEDKVLEAQAVELASLLTDDGALKVVVPGRASAHQVRLSLDRGTKK